MDLRQGMYREDTKQPAPMGVFAAEARKPVQVEIVVPVYNEQDALAHSINRLYEFLSDDFPFTWSIVVADNASTDDTLEVANQLAAVMPELSVLHLDQKGRGRALRRAWSISEAEVVAYMDVDLSTDLAGLMPLVAPLLSGHSSVAIGTRLDSASRVERGQKREFISRSYNRLLRTVLRAKFSDAQCGFKAIRTEVAKALLPQVKDEQWFFDTELLIVAQRNGLRIHEVPVDWVDDPNSSVDVTRTAIDDLRGMSRMAMDTRLAKFIAIGIVSSIAYAWIFLMLRLELSAGEANAIALAITAVGNTAANRHFTFNVRGRERLVREHAMGAVVFVTTLLLTTAALAALRAAFPDAPPVVEVAVLLGASVGATVLRFVALHVWVFAHHRTPDLELEQTLERARAERVEPRAVLAAGRTANHTAVNAEEPS
jgi:putative flippase GtrA